MKRFVLALFFICSTACNAAEPAVRNYVSVNIVANDWYWFITHLNFKISTKHLTSRIADFDPAISIYDEDTGELILTLQRITVDGKNTNISNDNLSIKIYTLESNEELLIVYENDVKILSLQVGGEENKLFSYKPNGETDFKCCTQGHVLVIKSLIRLYPSYMFVPGDRQSISDFFTKLMLEKE